MKKIFTGIVTLLAGAVVAYSQGTISFGNYAAISPYIYVSLVGSTARLSPPYTYPPVLLGGFSTVTTGNPVKDAANGNDWTVALYGYAGWNDPSSMLMPVMVEGSRGTPVTATFANAEIGTPGTWYSTATGDIPGTTLADQQATVQLYAWYNDGGKVNSYATAYADGYPTGFSATANVLTGGPQLNGQTLDPTSLPSFQGVGGSDAMYGGIIFSPTQIPEPTTISLYLMAAAAFFSKAPRKPSG